MWCWKLAYKFPEELILAKNSLVFYFFLYIGAFLMWYEGCSVQAILFIWISFGHKLSYHWHILAIMFNEKLVQTIKQKEKKKIQGFWWVISLWDTFTFLYANIL